MRAFVALDLPQEALDSLEALVAELSAGRIVARENLHLTLAFLGDREDALIEAIADELRQLRLRPIEFGFNGLGSFGKGKAGGLWVNVEASDALAGLQKKVRRAADDAGLALPRERFRPHVTLARYSRSRFGPDEAKRLHAFLERHVAFHSRPFTAQSFSLFRSHLLSTGAEYERLESYPLA